MSPSSAGGVTLRRLLVAVVVLAGVGVAVTLLASSSGPDTEGAVPGERLTGAVSAQATELDGELQRRTVAARLDAAGGNASRAAVVADAATRIEVRLGTVAAALEAARTAHENGTLSDSAYRNRVTRLVAESELLEARANYLAAVAADLPATVQAEYDVAPARLRSLADRAAALGTAEQHRLARSLAGDDIGERLGEDDQTDGEEAESGGDEGDVEPTGTDDDPPEDDPVEGEPADDDNGSGDDETERDDETEDEEEADEDSEDDAEDEGEADEDGDADGDENGDDGDENGDDGDENGDDDED
jgi:hypothetical protein